MGNLVGIKVSLSFMEVSSSFLITCPGVRSYLDRGSDFGRTPGVNFPLKEGFGRLFPWRVSFIHRVLSSLISLFFTLASQCANDSYQSTLETWAYFSHRAPRFLFSGPTQMLERTGSHYRLNGLACP